MDRRRFLGTAIGAGATLSAASAPAIAGAQKTVKIIGVSCSPRKGKTTATVFEVATHEG